MSQLRLFRQQRVDGAVRDGLSIDGQVQLEHFVPGTDEEAVVLAWFVDIRIEGTSLPSDPLEARDWVRTHIGTLQQILVTVADEMPAGLDRMEAPYQREFREALGGLHLEVIAFAVAREDLLQIPRYLREYSQQIPAVLEEIATVELGW